MADVDYITQMKEEFVFDDLAFKALSILERAFNEASEQGIDLLDKGDRRARHYNAVVVPQRLQSIVQERDRRLNSASTCYSIQ